MKLPHTWCNVHEPIRQRDEDQASDYDTFEIVAAAEQKVLDIFHINLQGKTMAKSKTQTAPVVQAPVVHTRHAMFDPQALVEEHIKSAPFAARLTSSMAWLLDNQCITLARIAQATLYKERDSDHDDLKFSEFSLQIDDYLARDTFWNQDNEHGFDEPHPLTKLAQVISLRDAWHDAAATAASADNRDYRPKDFDQLIVNEKARQTSLETREKYEMLIKRRENLNDQQRADRLVAMVRRDHILAEERLTQDRENMATTLSILYEAGKHAHHVNFHQLPEATQKSFAGSIIKIARRISQDDLAKQRSITTLDYADILDESDALEAALQQFIDVRVDKTRSVITQSQSEIDEARAADARDQAKAEADAS